MKKLILPFFAILTFAMPHGETQDPALKEALKGHYKKAFSMFEKRCDKNDAYACGMVGFFYDKGFGVSKNHNLALKFYKKGCNLNDADSCTLLGYNAYKKGELKEAKKLLRKGCNLGNKDACNYLNKF